MNLTGGQRVIVVALIAAFIIAVVALVLNLRKGAESLTLVLNVLLLLASAWRLIRLVRGRGYAASVP